MDTAEEKPGAFLTSSDRIPGKEGENRGTEGGAQLVNAPNAGGNGSRNKELLLGETRCQGLEPRSLKSFQRGDFPGLERVDTLYGNLSSVVTSLSHRVKKVLNKQENEFFHEYEKHLETTAKEVSVLQKRLKQSEDRIKNDTRVITLQQERNWFQQEALRLDKASVRLETENLFLREQTKAVEEERAWFEKQLKKARKQNRLLTEELQIYMEVVSKEKQTREQTKCVKPSVASRPELNQTPRETLSVLKRQLVGDHLKEISAAKAAIYQVSSDEAETGLSEQLAPSLSEAHLRSSAAIGRPGRPKSSTGVSRSGRSAYLKNRKGPRRDSEELICSSILCQQKVTELVDRLKVEKAKLTNFRAEAVTQEADNNHLRDLFLSCVDVVKKDVHRRQLRTKLRAISIHNSKGRLGSGLPVSRNHSDTYFNDLYKLKSETRRQLTQIDKKRILTRFLLKDEIFCFLYDRLFQDEKHSDCYVKGQKKKALQGPSSSTAQRSSGTGGDFPKMTTGLCVQSLLKL